MAEFFIVNSENTLTAFIHEARKHFETNKYVTYKWRIGPDRSLDQNALFHVWITEFICHLVSCHKSKVTDSMKEQTKKDVKKFCYLDTGWDFMVYEVASVLTDEVKRGYTSSTTWGRGEMYNVLCWFQAFAAQRGCILEAKGEFAKLKRKELNA